MSNEPNRDHRWLEALFDAHHQRLLAFAVRRVGHDCAEDVVAEVFATAWRRRDAVPDAPLAWLFQVARNHVLHEYRSKGRRSRLQDLLALHRPDTADDHSRVEVDSVLDHLSPELMRTADPARDVGPLPPARRAAVLEAATTARPVPIRPGRRPLRWVAAAAALAFVGGAAALQFRGTPAAEARADEVLETAAINATDPAVTPGQYWAVTTSTTGVMGVCETESNEDCYNGYVYRSTRTDYIEVTGSLPSWHVDGEIEVVEVLDERAANPLHPDPNVWTTNLAPNDFPGGWQQTSPAWLAALPRDHELLRERLYAESAQGNDKSAFTYATDLLRSGLVPADLRASLFEVIASIPGTIVTEEVATVDSREGVAIGRIEDGEVKSEIIIDPEVGQVIAERGYSEDPVVRQWDLGTTYDRRLVDSIPQEVSEIAVRQVCTPPTSDNATTCEVE